MHTELYERLFPEHPLGWEIVGTEDTILSMRADDIRSFHAEWYRPSNFVIAAAGPVDHDELVASVAGLLDDADTGRHPKRTAPVAPPHHVDPCASRVESAHVALGWRSVSHDDPERYALAIANQLIGVGLSSRLFQEVREERGLAYSVFSSMAAYGDTGVFTVYAGTTPPSVVAELLDVVDAQIDDVVRNGPNEHELAVAKGAFAGATLIALEDTGSRMARLATSMVLRERVIALDEYLGRSRRSPPKPCAASRRVLGGRRRSPRSGPKG